MKNVVLIGASGFVGSAILKEAHNRGHRLTAVVRDGGKIQSGNPGNMGPGVRTGKYRLGKDDMLFDENGESFISVEDYAVAMIDELEQENHHCERFTAAY